MPEQKKKVWKLIEGAAYLETLVTLGLSSLEMYKVTRVQNLDEVGCIS